MITTGTAYQLIMESDFPVMILKYLSYKSQSNYCLMSFYTFSNPNWQNNIHAAVMGFLS